MLPNVEKDRIFLKLQETGSAEDMRSWLLTTSNTGRLKNIIGL